MSTMTQNALGISSVAKHCWCNSMPVSFAVQQCIEQGFFRTHIKRFIQTIYEQMETDYDLWLTHGHFGDGA